MYKIHSNVQQYYYIIPVYDCATILFHVKLNYKPPEAATPQLSTVLGTGYAPATNTSEHLPCAWHHSRC